MPKWHTTNISWMNDQYGVPPYCRDYVFITVTSGHLLPLGRYSTTSIRIDVSAACIFTTRADLPSLPHRSVCTLHIMIFSLQKRWYQVYRSYIASYCVSIRCCFINPHELGLEPALALPDLRAERGTNQAAEKVEIQQELRQDVKQLSHSSMLIPKSGSL